MKKQLLFVFLIGLLGYMPFAQAQTCHHMKAYTYRPYGAYTIPQYHVVPAGSAAPIQVTNPAYNGWSPQPNFQPVVVSHRAVVNPYSYSNPYANSYMNANPYHYNFNYNYSYSTTPVDTGSGN